jgi:hypothetical protein
MKFAIAFSLFCGICVAQSPRAHGIFGKLDAKVENEVLQQLRPYFPEAKTKLDRNGNLIILTCLRNAGPEMLKQIQPAIENQFYTTELPKKLVLALSGARRVDVGFERNVLVFDLNNHRDGWIPGERIPGYIEGYDKLCTESSIAE